MSREHAHAYEAGYRDGSINYELEHCPACKNVADLQEALDENAKLQNDADLLRAMLSQVHTEKRCYMAENAKLRELVEDMLREFADEVYADADNEIRDRDFLCAKYAKRLTLAETEDA